MQSLPRTALTAARRGRVSLLRQPRRYAHEEHGHAHQSAPVNESFGKGFWGTVLVIPAFYIVYQASRPGEDGSTYLTRLIHKYGELQDDLAAKNDMHVQMIEQAGRDRVLFFNSAPSEHVPLKFPEIMSHGSPYNVVAGSQADISHVIAKFRKEQMEDEARKLEDMKNGTLKAEQPVPERVPKKPASSY
ncbi:hypothetical protein EJ04DRAFT_506594 [Polyplosphaeria fusca]|uniref:Uncharacterized protein n=1 Tax=Polyplosphaeria fusca TaxID=682080 RepID=A0A9P4UVI1_9PLEO|nr:hypothetical protein EJ04DRAFT_506594 [Polyplosphaeria fusca]